MSALLNCTATVTAQISVIETAQLDLQTSVFRPNTGNVDVFINGTESTSFGIDDHYEDALRTLAPSASHVYTMSALLDTLPRNNPFVGIRGLIISVSQRVAGDYLSVEPNSVNGWTAFIPTGAVIKVYNQLLVDVGLTDFYAVASGSNDQLKIINSGSNPIVYSFGVIGVTN